MCQTCKKASKLSQDAAFEMIATAMKKGKDPEHFKATLDKILGTEEPAQDVERDAAWEGARRNS